jgi:ACS family hexuronate transporter-like MFS transporter
MRPEQTRWVLVGLLFLATTLNYLDRQTLSTLAPLMQKDLGLDNEALGWLFAVFYYSYTFAQFAVGSLLDRTNLRWAYGFGVLLWSAVAALTGLAGTFAVLMVFRLLLGVTESVNWPAAMRVVARTLPPEKRSLGNGIFTSGTSIGALIAPILILGIADYLGWRWGFIIVGLFGVIWFLLWVAFTGREGLRFVWRRQSEEAAQRPAGAAYQEILSAPMFWRVFAITILVNPCLYFSVNWLPTYLVQARDLDVSGSLRYVLTLVYLGLDLGNIFCGIAVIWLIKRRLNLPNARRVVILLSSVMLACCGLVPFAATLGQAVALLVITNFGAGAWIAMYLTLAQEVSESNVATAAGLLGGSGSLAGAFAMWAVGAVTKNSGSFLYPMIGVTVAAALAAVAGFAALRLRPTKAAETVVATD